MNFSFLGVAVACAICGVIDYRKTGWVLRRPARITPLSLLVWLIDRLYLLYAVATLVLLVAFIFVPPFTISADHS